MPNLPYGPLDEMNLRELYDLMRNLTPRDRRDVLEYARLRYRLSQEEGTPRARPTLSPGEATP